jgi:serine protease AprX
VVPKFAGQNTVAFEAVLKSASGQSMFAPGVVPTGENIDQFTPSPAVAAQAANELRNLGFTVRHVGTFSISGEAPVLQWQQIFKTKLKQMSRPLFWGNPKTQKATYYSPVAGAKFTMPAPPSQWIDRAYPQRPPIFLQSPLSPRVKYHHLELPAEVAMICRSPAVHREGVRGKGVLVAMPDSGFYKHPYYAWHAYNYHATLVSGAQFIERDENGHGTAQAANIFANAPDIEFLGVKMNLGETGNTTLDFKTASDLYPAVMTCSWAAESVPHAPLPGFLKPLEAAVIEAVHRRGITVCFAGGNEGVYGFPNQMPDVIAAGGVYAHEGLVNGDFDLEASDFTDSYDGELYPGRHVPDLCGLVGMQPMVVYIMMPTQPQSACDVVFGGKPYPNKDETLTNDGWMVASRTRSASPQLPEFARWSNKCSPGYHLTWSNGSYTRRRAK